jgi:hypothetical protein
MRDRARTLPVVHMASFPLPEQRDDFGGNVTAAMRSRDVFVTLFEYGTEAAHQPLFAKEGLPHVTAALFHANRLQRRRAGQVGFQEFFRVNGRAFCLYVVAGSRASLPRIVREVNAALATVRVSEPSP